jgi:threonine dehydratase
VQVYGKDFDEARAWVEDNHKRLGMRYIHSANEPLLVAGVGTIGLEMIYARPDLDAVIAPIGGGSGAAGSSIALKSINPAIRMIGVQSAHAPVVYESWKEKRLLSGLSTTFAEGIATRQAFELTLGILIQNLDDFVLVTDDELFASIRMLFEHTHNVAEGAGAASLAAAVKMRKELAGKKVGLDLSGGNITAETLKLIFR